MATQTHVEIVDDIDGEPAAETVTFGIDEVTYEIDLSESHADDLRDVLEKWVSAARRVGGRHQTAAPKGAPAKSGKRGSMTVTELPAVRPPWTVQERRSMQKFARDQGLKVPADRGRISEAIITAWSDAGRPT